MLQRVGERQRRGCVERCGGHYQDQVVGGKNADEDTHLACHIAESLYRRMPYSALEKRSLTRALRWRKRKQRLVVAQPRCQDKGDLCLPLFAPSG